MPRKIKVTYHQEDKRQAKAFLEQAAITSLFLKSVKATTKISQNGHLYYNNMEPDLFGVNIPFGPKVIVDVDYDGKQETMKFIIEHINRLSEKAQGLPVVFEKY